MTNLTFRPGTKLEMVFHPKQHAWQYDVYELTETLDDCFVQSWGPYFTFEEVNAARQRIQKLIDAQVAI